MANTYKNGKRGFAFRRGGRSPITSRVILGRITANVARATAAGDARAKADGLIVENPNLLASA